MVLCRADRNSICQGASKILFCPRITMSQKTKTSPEGGEAEDKRESNNWIRVILATSGAVVKAAISSASTAQSAVMLPQLREPDSYIKVTADDESWIASIIIICSLPGTFICGSLIDKFGRKRGIQCFYFFMTLGFGITACAQEVWHILVGRALCGLARGFGITSVVYIAEIANKQQRSAVFAALSVMKNIGPFMIYIAARYCHWNSTSAGIALVCFVFLCTGFFIPETPSWLLKKGLEEKALQSFQKLGKSKEEIEVELKHSEDSKEENIKGISFKTFLKPNVWKPFAILFILYFLGMGGGFNDFSYYNNDFISSLDTTYDPLTISTILYSLRIAVSSSLGSLFTAKFRRKVSFSISGFLMGVGALGAGIYEYVYMDLDKTQKPMQLIPILCISLYFLATVLGVINLPALMTGEMFALEVRGVMSALMYLIATVFTFISVKIYIVRVSFLNVYGYLFSVAVASFLMVLFGIFVLTETQNRTLQEIEDEYNSGKKTTLKKSSTKLNESSMTLNKSSMTLNNNSMTLVI